MAVAVLIPFLIWGDWFMQTFDKAGVTDWLQRLGPWAWLAAMGLLVGDLFLPVPATPVMAALGWVYGRKHRCSGSLSLRLPGVCVVPEIGGSGGFKNPRSQGSGPRQDPVCQGGWLDHRADALGTDSSGSGMLHGRTYEDAAEKFSDRPRLGLRAHGVYVRMDRIARARPTGAGPGLEHRFAHCLLGRRCGGVTTPPGLAGNDTECKSTDPR